jgi:hypothetical protein
VRKKCQGIVGLHWRTRAVEEVASYTADFAWNPDLRPAQFFKSLSLRCYGPQFTKEMAEIHENLENLGPRWSGLLGQIECNVFNWIRESGSFSRPSDAEVMEGYRNKRRKLICIRDSLREILVEMRYSGIEWPLERVEYISKMADWILAYDETSLELREGGPVEKLLTDSLQALKKKDLHAARILALNAWERIQRVPFEKAMRIYGEMVSNRGELGVLATINLKANASYLSIEKRISILLGDFRSPTRLKASMSAVN